MIDWRSPNAEREAAEEIAARLRSQISVRVIESSPTPRALPFDWRAIQRHFYWWMLAAFLLGMLAGCRPPQTLPIRCPEVAGSYCPAQHADSTRRPPR